MSAKVFMSTVSIGILLAVFGWLGQIYYRPNPQVEGLAVIREGKTTGLPEIGGPFRLIDHQGQERSDVEFKGRLMLVYFGYSFCPDICPAALYSMTKALESLGEKARAIQPIFITIDPGRDTSSHLARYLQNFHPSFIGLTGSADRISSVTKAYKVHAARAKPDGTTTEYLMDHSSIIYLMDRQGRFVAHFNHTTSPEDLAQALKLHL